MNLFLVKLLSMKTYEIKNYQEEENERIIIPGFVDLHCHGGMALIQWMALNQ